MEVEYSPSSVVTQAMPVLTEFIEQFVNSNATYNIYPPFSFFPDCVESKPEVLKKTAPEPYSALETLYQYSLLFSVMRKRAN